MIRTIKENYEEVRLQVNMKNFDTLSTATREGTNKRSKVNIWGSYLIETLEVKRLYRNIIRRTDTYIWC